MSLEVKLTPEQAAVIEELAGKLVILGPQDFTAAMSLWVGEYAKAIRAKYPNLPAHKIESAVFRFGDLILRRFAQLNLSTTCGGAVDIGKGNAAN